jgi:hypothetical protein
VQVNHDYSYVAFFEDGSSITHDNSKFENDTSNRFEGKTLFTDVLFKCGQLDKANPLFENNPELFDEMEKNKVNLVSFVLYNKEKQVGVDLRDGHFEVNGQPHFQHRPDIEPYKNFRIIYYRTVKHEINQQSGIIQNSYAAWYVIGWQVTHKGKNFQQIMLV